jgi:hypothetical protein
MYETEEPGWQDPRCLAMMVEARTTNNCSFAVFKELVEQLYAPE